MTPITECSRDERMERALMAIEALTAQFGEGALEDFQTVPPDQIARFVSAVYCISHAALGWCGNAHEDWLRKIEAVEAEGVAQKLYDPEKGLARARERLSER
jgi:hypothetical protein